jgi:glycosyltransferase involved in cell wall biosynthesis
MHRYALTTSRDVDWHYHVQLSQPGNLELIYPELRPLIIRSPYSMAQWLKFFVEFFRVCRGEKIDVVHVHADLMSAPYALAARLAGARTILIHVHNADENVPTPSRLKASLFRPILRAVGRTMADKIVGISNHTLDGFLAGRARRPERDIVHYYGVDPTRFEAAQADRAVFRRELELANDARILLFAGRMVPEKNPLFALDVLAHMRRLDPKVAGLFVGSGSLDAAVRARAEEFGLGTAFRHLGWRDDLAEIMGCCDWFILPHPESPPEGFGLAVVEAQLAGLRLLLSHGVPDDPLLPAARFCRLALADGAAAWAKAAMDLLTGPAPSRAGALADLKNSPMDMERALNGLIALHGDAIAPEKILSR